MAAQVGKSRSWVAFLIVWALVAQTAFGYDFNLKAKRRISSDDRIGGLNYPPLPEELLINGASRPKSHPGAPVNVPVVVNQQWGLKTIGFFDVFNPALIPADPKVANCSDEIVVAVIDTGIDYQNPLLSKQMWVNRGESGPWTPPSGSRTDCRDKSCNGIDDDGNGFVDDVAGWDFVHEVPLPYDTHGHGTHIAGIISGQMAAGSMGVVGICQNVSIMALKYYDSSALGFNNLKNTVRAIEYAVANGAHIINYSGGGNEPATPERLAVEQARKHGILFVAAAGNEGQNNDQVPYFPASYPLDNLISVASINRDKRLLTSSNYGAQTVDIAAPGLGIKSILPFNRTGEMSGTSQATAFVTGAAALLASQMSLKEFDYRKIRQWLLNSGTELALPHRKGLIAGGVLSLPNALRLQARDRSVPRTAPAVAYSPSGDETKIKFLKKVR